LPRQQNRFAALAGCNRLSSAVSHQVIKMGPLALLFIALPFIALSVHLNRLGRRKIDQTLKDAFAKRTFQTPDGTVSGATLRVVKISKQTSRYAADEVYRIKLDSIPADAFWYCVGPGPSYFLAIAVMQTGNGQVTADWIVRPLTEQSMRAALLDDRKAAAIAFGEAMEG